MDRNKIKCVSEKNKHFYIGVIPQSSVPSSTGIDCVEKPALIPWAVKVVTQKAIEEINKVLDSNSNFFQPDYNSYPNNPFRLAKSNIENIIIESKTAPKKIFKESGEVGSLTHQHISRFLCSHDEVEIENERVKAKYDSFKRFMYEHKVSVPKDVIYSEKAIGSKIFKFGGSCDAKMIIDGKVMLLDWKTSTYLYESNWRQIASYWACDEEMGSPGGVVEKLGLVRLIDDSSYEFKTIDLEEAMYHFNRFKCLLDFWWLDNDRKIMLKQKKGGK